MLAPKPLGNFHLRGRPADHDGIALALHIHGGVRKRRVDGALDAAKCLGLRPPPRDSALGVDPTETPSAHTSSCVIPAGTPMGGVLPYATEELAPNVDEEGRILKTTLLHARLHYFDDHTQGHVQTAAALELSLPQPFFFASACLFNLAPKNFRSVRAFLNFLSSPYPQR